MKNFGIAHTVIVLRKAKRRANKFLRTTPPATTNAVRATAKDPADVNEGREKQPGSSSR
jgi:hypothetical protein